MEDNEAEKILQRNHEVLTNVNLGCTRNRCSVYFRLMNTIIQNTNVCSLKSTFILFIIFKIINL